MKVIDLYIDAENNIYDIDTIDIETLVERLNDLENKIDKIKDIYTSMQFSAPENMYIFIEKLGNILNYGGNYEKENE